MGPPGRWTRISPQPILFQTDKVGIEGIQVNDDSHFTQHDQSRTTGIDRTPLLQKIPRGREGVEDQNRPIENAEVIDVAFGQDKTSVHARHSGSWSLTISPFPVGECSLLIVDADQLPNVSKDGVGRRAGRIRSCPPPPVKIRHRTRQSQEEGHDDDGLGIGYRESRVEKLR